MFLFKEGYWDSSVELPNTALKFPPGIETIVSNYGGDSVSMALDELLEQWRNIKRLVIECGINVYFKTFIRKSVECLEVPDEFPSLRKLNLEILLNENHCGLVEDLKLKGISNLQDLTLG